MNTREIESLYDIDTVCIDSNHCNNTHLYLTLPTKMKDEKDNGPKRSTHTTSNTHYTSTTKKQKDKEPMKTT